MQSQRSSDGGQGASSTISPGKYRNCNFCAIHTTPATPPPPSHARSPSRNTSPCLALVLHSLATGDNPAARERRPSREQKGQCQPPGCSPGQLRGDSPPPAHWAHSGHRMRSREWHTDVPQLVEALSGSYTDGVAADGEYQASQRWPDTMPPNVCTPPERSARTSGQALTSMPQPTLRTRSSACPPSPPL